MAAAYAAHPERFIRAIPQPPALPTAVWINPSATEVANIQYLTITAQAGVTHTHPNPPLAGIIFNSID